MKSTLATNRKPAMIISAVVAPTSTKMLKTKDSLARRSGAIARVDISYLKTIRLASSVNQRMNTESVFAI